MDGKNEIPLLLGQSQEGLVAQDTSIGDEDVDATEFLDSNLDNLFALFSGADSSSGLASGYNIKMTFQHAERRQEGTT